jgi:hypothetical protein
MSDMSGKYRNPWSVWQRIRFVALMAAGAAVAGVLIAPLAVLGGAVGGAAVAMSPDWRHDVKARGRR